MENEKSRLVSIEQKNATYILAQGEEGEPPAYDYDGIVSRIDELDEAIRIVRHALHAFNAQTVIPEEGVTVDEALIVLAQMNSKLRRLERLRSVEPKKRLSSGYYSGKGIIEYEYANFDVKRLSQTTRNSTNELPICSCGSIWSIRPRRLQWRSAALWTKQAIRSGPKALAIILVNQSDEVGSFELLVIRS